MRGVQDRESPGANCCGASATSPRLAASSCSRTSRDTPAAAASSTSGPGSGFRFWVNVDRGMDPGYAEFNGASLAWLPPEDLSGSRVLGERRPRLGALRPRRPLQHRRSRDDRQSPGPSTSRTSSSIRATRTATGRTTGSRSCPASHFNFGERWEGERCFLWAEGTVRQEIVYGENLLLDRRYEAELGTSTFTLRDVVRNDGFYPTPHQLLYHFNIGYPVVDDGAELLPPVSGEVGGSIFDEETGPEPSAIGSSARPSGLLRGGLRDPDGDRQRTAGSRPPSSTAASRASTAVSAFRCATTRPRCRSTSSGE